jgi:hypothetical protein
VMRLLLRDFHRILEVKGGLGAKFLLWLPCHPLPIQASSLKHIHTEDWSGEIENDELSRLTGCLQATQP